MRLHSPRPIARHAPPPRLGLAQAAPLLALLALLTVATGCGGDAEVAAKASDVAAAADAAAGDVAAEAGAGQAAAVTVEASGPTDGPRVALDGIVESDGSITVRVLVRAYPELYAIASHLTWDPVALQLLDHKGHLMMQGDGYGSRSLVKPTAGGVLLLGAARFKDGGSPWSAIQPAKVGNELWATMRFKLLTDEAVLRFDADHSLAKDASYEAVKTGWQQLTIARTAARGGQ